MKARAKARMKQRRARFVVGYLKAGHCLYGCGPGGTAFDGSAHADPMTASAARRLLAKMPCADCAIFELVPVAVNR